MKRVVIPAPYWGQPGHLGWTRVERFVRWLGEEGVGSLVLRAGSRDGVEGTSFGQVVTIRDPIGFFSDPPPGRRAALPPRTTNRLRRTVAYLLMVPDPLVAWARRAAKHPLALEAGRSASMVLASSPPESVHVAGAGLARRLQAPFVMDLRDGWLDEPVIPLLNTLALQRLRHRRLEARLLRQAEGVLVTSEAWWRLLAERLPWVADKVSVVTNCYPKVMDASTGEQRRRPDDPLTLLYAGKFFGSRAERRVEDLFRPLLDGIEAGAGPRGRVLVVGNLLAEERAAVAAWRPRLAAWGWELELRPPVDRAAILELIRAADGLLLLSSSTASLPAKLFEYLPSGRPILAVAPRGSAVWEATRTLSQVWTLAPDSSEAGVVVARFLARCAQPDAKVEPPRQFSEESVRPRFLHALAAAGLELAAPP